MTEERLNTAPTAVHSRELFRQFSDEEATDLGIIQFIVDGAMKAKLQAHNSNIQYDSAGGGNMTGLLDNSALERLFKGEFLNQDYAKFYTDLLWECQLRKERHGQAEKKILLFKAVLYLMIECGNLERAKAIIADKLGEEDN